MHTLSHQTGDEVGILDRPDPVTDPPGLQTVEDLPDAVGSGRLPRVDRERRTGPRTISKAGRWVASG